MRQKFNVLVFIDAMDTSVREVGQKTAPGIGTCA